ncbi:hypothetical protein CR205_11790 [Alteribacter lacisalsi]|uniref:Cellobiose phosphorylase n=1 Tax=Alteribacter lacisalsi TaxID=2045244 RepID=A0A2W0HHX2_9BACI|nr:hypothetical protein [Alteribacter lacisalsi]PYZ96399.1 hypothetical protein CR205_11790 [Alteribacter lacisalsi]
MYKLTDNDRFEIKNYQQQPTFSSFLPGIAGVHGVPMWVFYVNRGQGIASFGVQDKDHAILEFLPADKSYQHTGVQGFRTFLNIHRADGTSFIEPFASTKSEAVETMEVAENTLVLTYDHPAEGIRMAVTYFILPESPLAGLVRHVRIENTSNKEVRVEALDGLPSILPSGVSNQAYKELGNTIKSWFDVENRENGLPFYKLRGSMEDTAEVKEVHEGSFFMSLMQHRETEKWIDPLVDRDLIFGADTSLFTPHRFVEKGLAALNGEVQTTTNKVSGGFSPVSAELDAGEAVELFTVVGQAASVDTVNRFAEGMSVDRLASLKEQAAAMTNGLTEAVNTKTGVPRFDAYTRQSYLDNGLRGGFPRVFEKEDQKKIYYLYSRKHGDLERDYNFFSISPTYYSQGNGNYRDMNQNRRCDVLLNPKVEDYNVKLFMNLIQLDGYNPLAVQGVRFTLERLDEAALENYVEEKDAAALQSFFERSFTPGELMHFVEDRGITLKTSFDVFLTHILTVSEESFQAVFGEGFWIDHWTYNLDLIDSYLDIYPDRAESFFFGGGYRFFDSPVRVNARADKYTLRDGKLRQYGAIAHDEAKMAEAAKNNGVLWVRSENGEGPIYETSLYAKLLLLALVKTSTLAPQGLGIEMEADKPGWNDSLNGLPGMLGASTSELFELNRLIATLSEVESDQTVQLPVEAADFLNAVTDVLEEADRAGSSLVDLASWHRISSLREAYRETIYGGISGEEREYSMADVQGSLQLLKKRVEEGIEQVSAYSKPLPPTYFYFEPAGELDGALPALEELTLEAKPVTPFLEGVVKSLKTCNDDARAKQIYEDVRASEIYDRKLKMYKTSAPVADEPNELGRVKAFTPGWLENESVFLHMEYKYLLATLQAGLVDEFYEDIQHALIPFLDPEVYGRSTLENSSFLASSANPDPKLHGRGFVSRLSGSTVEHLSIWFTMMAGKKPFEWDGTELSCTLSPTLPGWMFNEDGEVQFTFLGATDVTYINRSRKATYGPDAVKPVKVDMVMADGTEETVESGRITCERAEALRDGGIRQLKVYLS